MKSALIVSFYQRDLDKLIDEIKQFKNEEDLWRAAGTINNPAGNLVLHLIGGSSYHIGANIGKTDYVRDRDLEFSQKDVSQAEFITGLENLKTLVTTTLANLSDEDLEAAYPIPFDGKEVTVHFIVLQLLVHLNYHLGQINYLRRFFE
ncbi:DinB family protein [Mucilaginibacter ginkgonis]|uniref:DinB family protein n=1 Tax=Mucilaginibacter ginkgonis TaxID=2682091 RepID=A0A6I4I079_9SPHI|nr:DinB family protein [Mucilaginibacter ginkgonis]QQL48921.1 DinB family protein [Mucilaginibacter ginkgonis]